MIVRCNGQRRSCASADLVEIDVGLKVVGSFILVYNVITPNAWITLMVRASRDHEFLTSAEIGSVDVPGAIAIVLVHYDVPTDIGNELGNGMSGYLKLFTCRKIIAPNVGWAMSTIIKPDDLSAINCRRFLAGERQIRNGEVCSGWIGQTPDGVE